MVEVKFGDRAEVVASPGIVLRIAEQLEEWLVALSGKEEIDAERESIAMAQVIIQSLFNQHHKTEG